MVVYYVLAGSVAFALIGAGALMLANAWSALVHTGINASIFSRTGQR